MKRIPLFILAGALLMTLTLGGCFNISSDKNEMSARERDKLANEIAIKVVDKLEREEQLN